MNVERLHAIALAILNDTQNANIENTMQQLAGSLQEQVNAPQEPAFQQQVSQHLETLYTLLSSAPSNDFSPTWKQALRELGIQGILGNNFRIRIKEILERNQITPSVALNDLQALRTELGDVRASLDQIVSAFRRFNIGAEELEPGRCEIGVLIPRTDIDMLGELGKELEQLDKIFSIFAELTTGTRPGFQIRSISSTDFNLFWDMLPITASSAVFAIERIVALYKNMLEIRKMHGDLKEHGVPNQNIKGILDYSNASMKEGIEQLATELLEKYYRENDQGRRHELTTELRSSLTKIAKRIDKGYNLEVRVTPLPEEGQSDAEGETTPDEIELIKSIVSASKNLEFLKLEGDSILSLPESQDDQEEE